MQFFDVEHPDFGRTRVPETRLKHIERKGWKVVDGPPPGKYDPAEHTVDDVIAFLESAAPAERERVLAAEAAGKARVTILRADLTATTDSAPAPLPSVAAPLTTTTPEV